jgi:sensor domain CHASE-containing protein
MILILTGLAVLYMIATYGVFRFAVFPTFEDLERDLAAENAERIIQILDFERELLRSVNQDRSSWDATHDFMTGNNDTYPASNLTTDALTLSNSTPCCCIATTAFWNGVKSLI